VTKYHSLTKMPEFRIAQNVVSVDPSSDDTEVAPMLAAQRSAAAARSTWVSVVVNILLATVQVGVGLASKSQGLIADGIHSLSDLVSDFIVLLAGHHSKKEADEEHPCGHQRFETAASLALGVLLLVVGVGTSQWFWCIQGYRVRWLIIHGVQNDEADRPGPDLSPAGVQRRHH